MIIQDRLQNIAKLITALSKDIDSAINELRHDPNFRNHPECRGIESELCSIFNYSESSNKLNKAWRKIDKLK